METIKILKGLKKIFRNKNRWIKHNLWADSFEAPKANTKPLQFNNKIIKKDTTPVYAACIVGGIGIIIQNNPEGWPWNDVTKVANVLGFTNPSSLINWNNSKYTTHDKFIKRIDSAIKKFEKEVA